METLKLNNNRLADLRKYRGWTQKGLAQAMGLSARTIATWESDADTFLKHEQFHELAHVFAAPSYNFWGDLPYKGYLSSSRLLAGSKEVLDLLKDRRLTHINIDFIPASQHKLDSVRTIASYFDERDSTAPGSVLEKFDRDVAVTKSIREVFDDSALSGEDDPRGVEYEVAKAYYIEVPTLQSQYTEPDYESEFEWHTSYVLNITPFNTKPWVALLHPIQDAVEFPDKYGGGWSISNGPLQEAEYIKAALKSLPAIPKIESVNEEESPDYSEPFAYQAAQETASFGSVDSGAEVQEKDEGT